VQQDELMPPVLHFSSKGVFPESVVCVITSHAILEYRGAAFRNGAGHFMVKGESTGGGGHRPGRVVVANTFVGLTVT
jgi:hypothetical protein